MPCKTDVMTISPNYPAYAAKMRALVAKGVDLEVDARFVDMLLGRRARVLDVGCGIGTAVGALRQRGHEAFGVDPSRDVLEVAADLFDSSWYRHRSADGLSPDALQADGLPLNYDCLLLAGNVPAFLKPEQLLAVFQAAAVLLTPGGLLVLGTTTSTRGGPVDQDRVAAGAGLTLRHRFANWHLKPFEDDPWAVSIFAVPGQPASPDGPDGILVLR